jgi:hypothetical protein
MEQLQNMLDWMQANPWTTLAIIVYVIANLAPRPHPGKMKGWQKALWQIIDRLCLLTSHKVPGSLKFLLLDSPVQGSDGEVEKAPKVPDVDDDDGEDEEDDEDEGEGDEKSDSESEPAVVVDTEDKPDEPDGDGADEDDDKGSDSDGKAE